MKNFIKCLGIIAFTALIIFTMTACNRGGGGRGGTFTMTGIPSEYNGMYASFSGADEGNSDLAVISWEKLATLEKNSRISNGRVVLPLWVAAGTQTDTAADFERYSGNHTLLVNFYLHSSSSDLFPLRLQFWQFDSVKFSNGSAASAWGDGIYYGPDM